MSEQLALGLDLGPAPCGVRECRCGSCGAPVLEVDLGGCAAHLEPQEVVPGPFPCPRCSPYPHPPARCQSCGGSRVVGEPLPARGVAVDEHDRARAWRGGPRWPSEAVYRLHRCAGELAAAA